MTNSSSDGQDYESTSETTGNEEEEFDELERTFLANNKPARILVNSVPKSGTTWMRSILSGLPGYQAVVDGELAQTIKRLPEIQPNEVWHCHYKFSKKVIAIINDFDIKAVFIYRDIRDAVVSHYHHLKYLNPKRAPEIFDTETFEELVKPEVLKTWCTPVHYFAMVPKWLNEKSVIAVRYEDLQEDAQGTITRVLNHFGLNIEDALIERIVRKADFNRMSQGRKPGEEDKAAPLRKGIVGDWKNYLKGEIKKQFKQHFGHLLIEMGYEKDMNW